MVCPLAYLPEGDLAQPSQLIHNMRDFNAWSAKHIEMITGEQRIFLPYLFDLGLNKAWLNGIGNGFCPGPPVNAGTEEFLYFKDRSECIGPGTQVTPIGTDIRKCILLPDTDGGPDADADLFMLLIKYLGRKSHRA